MNFVDLFEEARQRVDGSPVDQQNYVRSVLPERVRSAGFKISDMRSSAQERGRRVLIGVSYFSMYDMQLLDAIRNSAKKDTVEIFMVGECQSQSQIEAFIPGITPVFQSPVVGIWDSETLIAKAWGWQGRQLLVAEGVINANDMSIDALRRKLFTIP